MNNFLRGKHKGERWRCFPTMISYCCNIPEGKDISDMKHSIAVQELFVRYLASIEDIQNLCDGETREMKEKEETRKEYRILMSIPGKGGRKRISRADKELSLQ